LRPDQEYSRLFAQCLGRRLWWALPLITGLALPEINAGADFVLALRRDAIGEQTAAFRTAGSLEWTDPDDIAKTIRDKPSCANGEDSGDVRASLPPAPDPRDALAVAGRDMAFASVLCWLLTILPGCTGIRVSRVVTRRRQKGSLPAAGCARTILTTKGVAMALEGDPVALRLCLERVLPPRRDLPVKKINQI